MRKFPVFLSLLCALLMACSAFAETVEVPDNYAPVDPVSNSFAVSGKQDVDVMMRSFYIADDEIWYSYYPKKSMGVIQRYDRNGSLLKEVKLSNLPGSDQDIQCITRVGDRLLVGITDGLTIRGTVIVLGPDYKEMGRVTLSDRVGILHMMPSPEGILCSGFGGGHNDGKDHFYLALVDAEGSVAFENTEMARESEVDRDRVGLSIACAGDDGYYAVVTFGQKDQWRSQYILTGFSKAGEVLWQTEVPEKTDVRGMTSAGQTVYIYGVVGDLDEYDQLINERAFVSAYSTDGAFLWQRVFIGPEQYGVGAADASGCYVLARTMHAETEVASIGADGEVRGLYLLNLPTDIHIQGLAVTDAGSLIGTGRTTENLFWFEVE